MFKSTVIALSLALALNACTKAPDNNTSNAVAAAPAATAQAQAPWWQDAVVYQIWPRSFYDTNADGIGDFKGIQAKLPYLQDLGINAIWLTPMFEAPSYHGYDFTEFYEVEQDYGSMADFEALVQDANSKNIKVILDLVINHISSEHDWFKRSAAGETPYKDYFIWRDELPQDGWGPAWNKEVKPEAVWHWNEQRKAYYYAAFGASQPDLNLTHPDVVAEMKKAAKFWLDKGVAGFRLDAVRYAIENGPGQQADTQQTIDYWVDFTQYVKSVNPEAYLVAEAWVDIPVAARYWGEGKGLDAGFDFDFGYKVLELLNAGAQNAEFGTMAQHKRAGNSLQNNFEDRKASGAPFEFFSPFLTNHDQPRLAWQLGRDFNKAKLAAAMLFASPGTTYIYYGEEIALTQASDKEHMHRRSPMFWDGSNQAGFTTADKVWVQSDQLFPPQGDTSWWAPFLAEQLKGATTVAAQQQDPKSVWSLYKFLIAQKKRPEFGIAGEYRAELLADGKLLKLSRTLGPQQSVILLNLSAETQAIPAELVPQGLHISWQEDETPELGAYQLQIWQS
ncbi:alpha-amylase family glycosyl hydrolase [Rheinheimera sp.]|uniref:alpha-amylase family glycosyl hydrolase n=1 Tax=Rheinheimera sp. TaxID=1869214 RepID=UPI00307FCB67